MVGGRTGVAGSAEVRLTPAELARAGAPGGSGAPGRRGRWATLAALAGPALVALGAFAVYRVTLLPGLGLWDTAEFQAVGPLLGTAHPTGYPSYVVLGWLASIAFQGLGSPAFAMNLLSAVLVALAVALTALLGAWLTGRTMLGIAAGVGLAFTPIAWSVAMHADPHAFHLALVALVLTLLAGWSERERAGRPRSGRWLVAAALVLGVSLANHSLTLLLLPGVLLFALAVAPDAPWRRPLLVARCVLGATTVAALFYAELPLRAGPFPAPMVYGHPETWDGFRSIVTGEQFRGAFNDLLANLPGALGGLADTLGGQLGPLAALVLPAFAATLARNPRWALLTGSGFVLTCLFDAAYVNADIGRYYLGPILFAWTWLAIGAGWLLDLVLGALADRPDRPARPLAVAGGAAALVLLVAPTALGFGERWSTLDESHDTSARTWTDAALATFDRDAVVLSWWSFSTPLWYAQRIEGRRPDLAVIDDRTRLDQHLGDLTDVIDASLGTRAVYLVRVDEAELDALRARYRLVAVPMPPGQPVFRVAARAVP